MQNCDGPDNYSLTHNVYLNKSNFPFYIELYGVRYLFAFHDVYKSLKYQVLKILTVRSYASYFKLSHHICQKIIIDLVYYNITGNCSLFLNELINFLYSCSLAISISFKKMYWMNTLAL